jgi:hypothetical protein
LEEASGSPLDICPVLSDATLSAIGQGASIMSNKLQDSFSDYFSQPHLTTQQKILEKNL